MSGVYPKSILIGWVIAFSPLCFILAPLPGVPILPWLLTGAAIVADRIALERHQVTLPGMVPPVWLWLILVLMLGPLATPVYLYMRYRATQEGRNLFAANGVALLGVLGVLAIVITHS